MEKNIEPIGINAHEGLVPVVGNDLEFLRRGKNDNRASFFHNAVITRSEQRAWFGRYQGSNREHMFIVCSSAKRVGILGLRLIGEGKAELYNVMRVGPGTADTHGLMSRALNALIQHYSSVHGVEDFLAVVVRGNPALKWYQRNGFQIRSENDEAVHIGRRGSSPV